MSHAEIIDRLGGYRFVAASLSEPENPTRENTVLVWRRRGIPARKWHRIVDLAARLGLTLTAELLEATRHEPPPPPKRGRGAGQHVAANDDDAATEAA